ncbi:DUF302 domain-containing protein [Candidatus Thiothrix anitrata]|jgi:cytochrome c oxidase cbb3-type subunit 3|uniref:DUF302 domain-containing protein n=1 Tax=Candidatus Thiothrix anitrata TaxID=2823902 RepID=A0ABX7X6L2_9GAMM|nr:DUF302 domain-containing protein [Candidatus Thiothrix anitrata]QTR50238.1 DUF302 domain-containing protein [Candidatus Thiothrix anitrata]
MKALKNLIIMSITWWFLSMTAHATTSSDLKLTLVQESPYSFEETLDALRKAILANNFRVFPDRYLEEGLTDEFSVNPKQVSVRFCNFNDLHEALQIEPQAGVLLPCTITVVEDEVGKVTLVTGNVKAMLTLFDNPRLTAAFQDLEDKYQAIIDEVTL